jgi:hypothetical protein
MEAFPKRTGIVLVHDKLIDRLGDLYRKYPFKMTFGEFLSMVIARMEERCGRSKKETGSRVDKSKSPYDPA